MCMVMGRAKNTALLFFGGGGGDNPQAVQWVFSNDAFRSQAICSLISLLHHCMYKSIAELFHTEIRMPVFLTWVKSGIL